MAKLKHDTILTATFKKGKHSFKPGTTKAKLADMAAELGEFTKQQWLDKAIEGYEADEYAYSRIAEETGTKTIWAKAWWNEFFTKSEVFIVKTDDQA